MTSATHEATKISPTHADHAKVQRIVDDAFEIACFEIGPQGLRRYVRVLQSQTDPFGLFVVEDFSIGEECEREPSDFFQYTTAALAFEKAVELAQEEIADVVDTVEG